MLAGTMAQHQTSVRCCWMVPRNSWHGARVASSYPSGPRWSMSQAIVADRQAPAVVISDVEPWVVSARTMLDKPPLGQAQAEEDVLASSWVKTNTAIGDCHLCWMCSSSCQV